MSRINYELELYKLIITPEETDLRFVSGFGWIDNSRFLIEIDWCWFEEFMDRLTEIFGYDIFEEGKFKATIQADTVCVDLVDAISRYIDIKRVFPKDKYKY